MLARKKLLLGVKWGIIKGTAIKILRTKPPKPYLKECIFNKNFKTRFESRDYLKKSIRSYTMVSYIKLISVLYVYPEWKWKKKQPSLTKKSEDIFRGRCLILT